MRNECSGTTRRSFLHTSSVLPLIGASIPAPAAPQARVSVARCPDYGPALTPTLRVLFDQLGGLGHLVNGKTVTVKLNMTGAPSYRMGTTPAERAQYTHPAVAGSLVHLLDAAGARSVRLVEGCFSSDEPLEEFMLQVGWDPSTLLNAARRVSMENTNTLGNGSKYVRFATPRGGHLFPGFDLNHAYADCDVLVSVAKLKEHATCGVTLAMKNMFGATPLTIYGDGAGREGPDERGVRGGRGSIMHSGLRPPSKSAPQPRVEGAGRDGYWRMPRIVADLAAACPVHLALIDGIQTMAGGEGPWIRGCRPVEPGLLIAGLNALCTDAVATACMGFDPMAGHGAPPFEACDSFLRLGEELGVGTRDLSRIEIAGLRVDKALFRFRA